MQNANSYRRGYVIAALFGALGGGLIVLLMTKAIPKLMSQLMSQMMSQMITGMMANMREQMSQCGCDPAEMCAKMMQNAVKASPSCCDPRDAP